MANQGVERLRIAVVGAGVAGLSVALYLHRAGHDVTVFERFEAPQPVGSGLMLQPTGLTILHDLGLADAILALGQRIERLVGQDAESGRTVLDVAYRGGRIGLGVHRSALFDVLHEAVRSDGIAVVTSADVAETREEGAHVSLRSEDGAVLAGSFNLVVDAAGTNSPLSRGQDAKPLAYGAYWATLDWPADDVFDAGALQQRYRWASVMIGVLPIGRLSPGGRKKAAFFWSVKGEDVERLRRDGLAPWKDRVRTLWPETAVLLDQIACFDDMTFASYAHRTLSPPFRGRVIHIGDSAHATSPQLGQGANMALLDARALASALEAATTVVDVGLAYARMRRRHVQVYQFLSYALTPFYQSDSALIPLARDTLVSTVARIPPMPGMLAALVSGVIVDPFRPLGLTERRFPSSQIAVADESDAMEPNREAAQ